VAVVREERVGLAGIENQVDGGGALVFSGPNGSGKSTLMRVLAGLRRPDHGTVLWDGVPIEDDLGAHARRVAYVGHSEAVKPGLTARENLAFAARTSGGDIEAALGAFGLSAYAAFPARMLSAGQRRRLALGRLVLSRAPLWLLDEPSVGLDAASIERLGEILARHRAGGGVVVATTHVPLPLPDAETLSLS